MEYRLNKYISNSGYCSRREADKFIETGNVTINGKRATIGSRVIPGQQVKVNGELIVNNIEPVYIAFNKPVGVVSTTDPSERDNIVNFVRHEQRIFPIGRLDKDSQGLILLTNDGDIVNKILRAGNNHKKVYIVTVHKPITKDFLTRMTQGVPILDCVTRKCEIEEINPYTFKISLIQGLNRQIRRMCEYFDYVVTKLERIEIMNIKLNKLGQGNWRDLTMTELEGLFDLLEDSEATAPVKAVKTTEPKKSYSGKNTSDSIRKNANYKGKNWDENYHKNKKAISIDDADSKTIKKKSTLKSKIKNETKNAASKPASKGKTPSGLRNGKQRVVKAEHKPKRKWSN